jgi:hypothetical protein
VAYRDSQHVGRGRADRPSMVPALVPRKRAGFNTPQFQQPDPDKCGALGGIRTPNLLIRSQML